uniref:Uncharacterized protein n=1 Tax=Panagrolaimus sp. PS1159 TaxID=55785 RepID=A0AC35GHB4_9BILA
MKKFLCSTPDSLIESGSDSASFIGSSSKKDHPRAQLNASGSEFGSLTSIQITQDDDLDSGVGGGGAARQHPPPVVINDSELSLNDPSNFEIRRLPARSTKDLTLEGCEESSPQMLSTHPLPPASSYASSRSMSNLHRTNASPQRARRKWDSPEYNNSSDNNGHVYQQPIQNPQVNLITNNKSNNPNSGLSTSISLQGLRSHTNYDSPLSGGPKNAFAPVPQRIVPGTYTNQHQHQQYPPTSIQQQQQSHHSGQMPLSSGYYEDTFDRANASRNSLTKKFMNLSSGPSSLAGTPNNEPPKTVWTPQKYENNRRPSNLFNNFSSAPNPGGIHRRQSEKLPSVSVSNMEQQNTPNSRRLFQRNSSSNNISTVSSPIDSSSPDLLTTNPNNIQLRRKQMDRGARRRLTVSAYADIAAEGGVSTPLSPGFPLKVLEEEDYESSPLHMRSQSPSSLLLNLESEQNRSRPSLRKNSEMGSTMSRITPSSSRSNLRSAGSTTINKSSQALNKMLEAKEKLKKSQENLALQIGEDATDSSPTSSNSMARSRSIGNLRRTQDNMNSTFNGFEESGLSDNKRQMARSVTSLHNNGEDESFRHPDEYTLQAQYGSNGRRQSSSRLADSIRNLQKLSNPDLTNEHLFEHAETSFGSGHNSSAGFNTSLGGGTGAAPYYSTTLPKSMRKGPVSKKVYKAAAARLDQTSESDSNTSDQTPNGGNGGPPFSGSYIKSAGSGFLRGNNGPLRSSSSVEAGRVAANRRMFDSGFTQQQQQPQQRKPQNYLAQKISQYDVVGQDNGIIDESSPRSMASFDVPMTDEHSKSKF